MRRQFKMRCGRSRVRLMHDIGLHRHVEMSQAIAMATEITGMVEPKISKFRHAEISRVNCRKQRPILAVTIR